MTTDTRPRWQRDAAVGTRSAVGRLAATKGARRSAVREKSGQKPQLRDIARPWRLLEHVWSLLPDTRQGRCHRVRRGPLVEVRSDGHSAWTEGLVTCGSVWTCPLCAARRGQERRAELQEGLDRWLASSSADAELLVPVGESYSPTDEIVSGRLSRGICRGQHSLLLETRTVRHGFGDDVKCLAAKMRSARNWFKGHRVYKGCRARVGAVGTVRAEELTYGAHGWHPHEHELWLCAHTLAAGERREVEIVLAELWVEACTRHGLPAPTMEHGLRLDNMARATTYVAKWGPAEEIALAAAKTGRRGGLSPWQILDASARGCARSRALWLDFARAYRGVRQLHWSRGLRARLGLDDWTAPARESAVVYVVASGAWADLVYRWTPGRSTTDGVVELLRAALVGAEDCARVLARARAGPPVGSC